MAVVNPFSASALSQVAAAGIALIVFFSAKTVYRLFFHPLAAFPGPKLVAVTRLYGAFFNLSPSSSSYVKVLPALHAEYGETTNVSPLALTESRQDLSFVLGPTSRDDRIFRAGTKFSKESSYYTGFAPLSDSFFQKRNIKDAMAHRNLYSAYFTREATRRAEPLVQNSVSKFLNILQSAASENEWRTINLSLGFKCLSSDVITNFMFDEPLGWLESPDFDYPMTRAVKEASRFLQLATYFPTSFRIVSRWIGRLPSWFLYKDIESLALTKWWATVARERILAIQAQSTTSTNPLPTIFDTALKPNTEKARVKPSIDDLTADTLLQLIAGTDTSAHALIIATYHVLGDTKILKKLQFELREAIPGKDTLLKWANLEKLPYLRGVIEESLRLSSGAPGHLPRVVPAAGAVLCGQRIAAGTIVSSSSIMYHHDPNVFPDPEVFRPERWLVGDEEFHELQKYMMPFSRGSRMCVAMNLGYMELYVTLGHLFRRFDLTVHGTSEVDMEWKDRVVADTMGELKVKVKEADE